MFQPCFCSSVTMPRFLLLSACPEDWPLSTGFPWTVLAYKPPGWAVGKMVCSKPTRTPAAMSCAIFSLRNVAPLRVCRDTDSRMQNSCPGFVWTLLLGVICLFRNGGYVSTQTASVPLLAAAPSEGCSCWSRKSLCFSV